MTEKKTFLINGEDGKELLVTGIYEYYDDEITEGGTTRYGSDAFLVGAVVSDGEDITKTLTNDQLILLEDKCLEKAIESYSY